LFSAEWALASTAIVVFVILAVFIAGLMVGRTPEYLGKKDRIDMTSRWPMLAILILTFTILGFSAVAIVRPLALRASRTQDRTELSQVLYAYLSSTGNNGSAFGGLNVNTMWYKHEHQP